MIKRFQHFAILGALLCPATCGFAQNVPPQAPTPKPRVAPGTQTKAPEPKAAEPKAAEPKPAEPKPAEPEPKRAAGSLEEMVRGQRDERWERERSLLRQSLEEAGLSDKVLQDNVVNFAIQQDASREVVRSAAARCWDAIRDPDLKSVQLAVFLKSYQDAALVAQNNRDKALGELDEKIHFSASPRLQMLLRLKGLLGSEAFFTGDAVGEEESFDLRTLYSSASAAR